MTMQQSVVIIGAGPAGLALAADLESQGRSVLVYSHPTHMQHARKVMQTGVLNISGALQTASSGLRITVNMSEAIAYSRIIILAVPSSGQQTLLQEMKKFSLREHTIIAIPGNLVSLIMEAEMDVGCIIESNLSPYSCRMSDGELVVMGKKRRLFVAELRAYGRGRNQRLPNREEIGSLFSAELKWCHSVVEVCLSNINGIFHPPMMLMNAGRIENTEGDFLFYYDGLTRSVANTIQAIDHVRLKIGEALGYRLSSVIEVSNACYDQKFVDLVDLAQKSGPHNTLKAPAGLEHRYFSEDVADLLVCWHGLAEKLGIDASPIKSIIILVKMATGIDYFETGRNLKQLDLETMSRDELIERFGVSLNGD